MVRLKTDIAKYVTIGVIIIESSEVLFCHIVIEIHGYLHFGAEKKIRITFGFTQ